VQRRGQPTAGREIALAAFGADEMERVGAIETIVDTGAAAEVEELAATAHRNVLTIIDQLAAGRSDERAGAAAEGSSSLEQFDSTTPLDGGDGRGDARKSPADDRDSLRGRSRGAFGQYVIHYFVLLTLRVR
jgi:hypothetical protein